MADLTRFDELNQRDKKAPWEERYEMVKEEFPSVERLDWNKALKMDDDLFGRILRDIIKIDLSPSGRPGPRSSLEWGEGMARLRRYMGVDYSLETFVPTFKRLIEKPDGTLRSVRNVAAKTGLNRSHVHRLLTGQLEPDVFAMTEIAKAFDKHPSYFLEYRTRFIASSVLNRVENVPEASINLYRQLMEAQEEV
jgi:transcriptional regulator with XRE-family HTH domain